LLAADTHLYSFENPPVNDHESQKTDSTASIAHSDGFIELMAFSSIGWNFGR